MHVSQTYTENDLIKIGARYHNTKRNYLLINPLQGKHIPVSPTKSLSMITQLGEILKEKYPETKLVIGFAETATAIGAGIASVFPDCKYICTTREDFPESDKIEFLEEHSHAAEQTLLTENLNGYINDTKTIIFVDDELSTGKTMRNILSQLTKEYPVLSDKNIVVASVINRLDEENAKLMSDNKIKCEALLHIPNTDYTEQVDKILPDIKSADDISHKNNIPDNEATAYLNIMTSPYKKLNPRKGVSIEDYTKLCNDLADIIIRYNNNILTNHITIIGTEECMYPAMIIGKNLENKGHTVITHSTTRSPIGIIDSTNYPIYNGYKLPSFYDVERETFIYDMEHTSGETTIIVTDSKFVTDDAINTMNTLLTNYGTERIIIVKM